ncbi:hypothetical protein C8A01DRAFT_41438 [Parachaetomium inaequale]|uniref:Uncharacterized protein n=1 Tax=Parachaetomium inaequale TaxID=2588326 RepID=A0AAN6P790_9PEZI|nr:hypothetical protein C8A01DRAFT_41438 [Parachaetomium inaequale]
MLATSAILALAGLVPVLLAAPADDVVARGGGINMVDACHQQYGNTWAAARSGSGKYDWYCVNSTNGNTGGIDLNAYCMRTYGGGSQAGNNGGLWDWYCT